MRRIVTLKCATCETSVAWTFEPEADGSDRIVRDMERRSREAHDARCLGIMARVEEEHAE